MYYSNAILTKMASDKFSPESWKMQFQESKIRPQINLVDFRVGLPG